MRFCFWKNDKHRLKKKRPPLLTEVGPIFFKKNPLTFYSFVNSCSGKGVKICNWSVPSFLSSPKHPPSYIRLYYTRLIGFYSPKWLFCLLSAHTAVGKNGAAPVSGNDTLYAQIANAIRRNKMLLFKKKKNKEGTIKNRSGLVLSSAGGGEMFYNFLYYHSVPTNEGRSFFPQKLPHP